MVAEGGGLAECTWLAFCFAKIKNSALLTRFFITLNPSSGVGGFNRFAHSVGPGIVEPLRKLVLIRGLLRPQDGPKLPTDGVKNEHGAEARATFEMKMCTAPRRERHSSHGALARAPLEMKMCTSPMRERQPRMLKRRARKMYTAPMPSKIAPRPGHHLR